VENLTWLTGLLTGQAGLTIWLVRWIVRHDRERAQEFIHREREIADGWRRVAETYAENDRRRSDTVTRNNEILAYVLQVLEQAPWVDTAPVGFRGFGESGGSRHRRSESPL
jgi:hypothetical protein